MRAKMLICVLGIPMLTGFMAAGAHAQRREPRISGVVHIQDLGDQRLRNRKWAGTRGEAKRLEGFSLELDRPADALRLEYSCHVEGIGDIGWMSEGSFCGTRGQSRRVEGFAIRLAGRQADRYSVKYQCHLEGIGDTQVVSDGAFCGTRGESRRLEAMRVWIVRK
jgi:uncharacterized protein YjdB